MNNGKKKAVAVDQVGCRSILTGAATVVGWRSR